MNAAGLFDSPLASQTSRTGACYQVYLKGHHRSHWRMCQQVVRYYVIQPARQLHADLRSRPARENLDVYVIRESSPTTPQLSEAYMPQHSHVRYVMCWRCPGPPQRLVMWCRMKVLTALFGRRYAKRCTAASVQVSGQRARCAPSVAGPTRFGPHHASLHCDWMHRSYINGWGLWRRQPMVAEDPSKLGPRRESSTAGR